jgi:hypothetical protein
MSTEHTDACRAANPHHHHTSKTLAPVFFMVMLPVYVLQSILTLAFVQSRVKTPELGAVSEQRPVGSP